MTATRRTRAFHHYTLGGDLSIEDEEVLDERIDEVVCRWCGTGTAVEVITEDGSVAPDPATGEAHSA